MKKNYIGYLLTASAFGLILLLILVIIMGYLQSPNYLASKLKPRQVWIYPAKQENPFKLIKYDTCYVIAIKEDYVQYIEKHGTKPTQIRYDTISCPKTIFINNRKLDETRIYLIAN